jgi:hypothetical protein
MFSALRSKPHLRNIERVVNGTSQFFLNFSFFATGLGKRPRIGVKQT